MTSLHSLFIISLCLIISTFSHSQAQKGKTEQKIIKSIDLNTHYYTTLLKEAVNINSGTMNFEGVHKVGELFKKELEALGFEAELTSGKDFNRSGHLVAHHHSKKGPKFLLIGHLDTVFELDNPFQTWSMKNDSIMNGPGVADMKGGDVIIILAMKALKEAGILDEMSIEIIMTGDEEKSGSPLNLSKKALTESAKWADIALGFENADGDPKTIVTSRRGSLSWSLEVKGKAAHSSQVFSEKVGTGSIYETSRILTAFYQELSAEPNLTFNPGFIIGGTQVEMDEDGGGGSAHGKTNVVAQSTMVRGDIRAESTEQLERAKKIMHRIVSENLPQTSAILTFSEGGYPPLARTEGNTEILSYYNQVSQDLGFGPVTAVNPRNAGAADISFTSGYVEMATDGLGLSGADDHTIHETGNLNMLPIQAKKAAILMYRLSKK
ncbi:M20/M25/M40 family metallo-hydrolase [Fulvivirga sediminis]|uniref:M20/M25/M40 family metallo-hydrolase n=1 Tax=Fulvivirga sediminis TaxID=2803949 RepID=A0A937F426_9BACT|nr:M20/M25/M40 family metallo-hydrolase [Fulvivirga sediminis]MBL3655971.1 M20/M25/M40 family metallo-hydrolase [Fulvivirga sediminis]